jgi:hypothetical protein
MGGDAATHCKRCNAPFACSVHTQGSIRTQCSMHMQTYTHTQCSMHTRSRQEHEDSQQQVLMCVCVCVCVCVRVCDCMHSTMDLKDNIDRARYLSMLAYQDPQRMLIRVVRRVFSLHRTRRTCLTYVSANLWCLATTPCIRHVRRKSLMERDVLYIYICPRGASPLSIRLEARGLRIRGS